MSDVVEITTTVESAQQARELANRLIEKRLAACVQITGPIHSVYRWEGKIASSEEFRCTIKSLRSRLEELMQNLQDFHPYDVPEILVVAVDQVAPDYQQWLNAELG